MQGITESQVKPIVDLIEVPAKPCLTIKAKMSMADMPAFLQKSYGKLYGYAGSRTTPQECFARYPSWTEKECEVEAGVVTRDPLPSQGELVASQFGGHKALHVLHKGPYAAVGPAYEALQEEIKTKELKTAGAPYEVYLNDPHTVPESKLLTDIYWPVE